MQVGAESVRFWPIAKIWLCAEIWLGFCLRYMQAIQVCARQPRRAVVSLSHEGNAADHLKMIESSAWKHKYFYKYVAVKGNLHVRYASHGPYPGEFIRGCALRSEARAVQ